MTSACCIALDLIYYATDWTYLSTHTAAAIAIHNFPEGIATFIVGLARPELGIALAIAIAVHNIPEGISIIS